jgi:tetratricopeptide (TPR) repeat protein
MVVNAAQPQSTRSLINDGNGLYEDGKYDEAEINYRKALEKEQGSLAGHFNLGNSLSKQKKFDQSIKEFETPRAVHKRRKPGSCNV